MVAVIAGAVLVWIALTWNPTQRIEPTPAPAPIAPAAAPPSAPAAAAPPPANPGEAKPAPANPQPATAQPAAPEQAPTPAPNGLEAPQRSGPVDEYKQLFASEPRASTANDMESRIEGPFRRPEVLPGLFKSVMCRTTICRIETRWSQDRAAGFLAALMRVVTDRSAEQGVMNQGVAISPEGEAGPDGSRVIDVYLKRLPAGEHSPSVPVNPPASTAPANTAPPALPQNQP